MQDPKNEGYSKQKADYKQNFLFQSKIQMCSTYYVPFST